ncbi:hypothetical protein VTH06DRAFT_929 [Thermothelomyces fergusii]
MPSKFCLPGRSRQAPDRETEPAAHPVPRAEQTQAARAAALPKKVQQEHRIEHRAIPADEIVTLPATIDYVVGDKHQTPYRIIGGLALRMLGSRRDTADYDPRAFHIRNQNRSGRYTVAYVTQSGTAHNVDAMEPQMVDMSDILDKPSRRVNAYSATIPAPEVLLELKGIAWRRRDDKEAKKQTDGLDIGFLERLIENERGS